MVSSSQLRGVIQNQKHRQQSRHESSEMATIPSPSLSLPNPFPISSSSRKIHFHKSSLSITARATEPETPPSDSDPSQPQSEASDDAFENRMNEFRLRYRSGTGKKAELRKVRKSKKTSTGSSVYLPPVPLKEPVSAGLKVDFGFSPFSERLNGRIAGLGLTALLLVEIATGKGVINYHSPVIVLIQIYFVAAVSALYVKYEKEKIRVWPQSSTNE